MFPLVKSQSQKERRKGEKKVNMYSVFCHIPGIRGSEAQAAAEFCAILPETQLDWICGGKLSSTSPLWLQARK